MLLSEILGKHIIDGSTPEQIKSALHFLLTNSDCSIEDLLENIRQLKSYLDLSLFNDIVDYLALHKMAVNNNDGLSSILQDMYLQDEVNVNELIIQLIIDDNGYKRFWGRNLWDHLGLWNSNINILDYEEDVQARFAISMLQDLLFPDNRLPKVMDLFNSPSSSVRVILVSSLQPYTLNYYGFVLDYFNNRKFKKTEELLNFKEFLSFCEHRFDFQKDCNEMDSDYAMNDVYRICKQKAKEHLKKQFNVSNKKKFYFPQFFPLVILGRGGGWRRDDGTAQSLMHYKNSLPMPMMIYSHTPLESREFDDKLFFDWTKLNKKDE